MGLVSWKFLTGRHDELLTVQAAACAQVVGAIKPAEVFGFLFFFFHKTCLEKLGNREQGEKIILSTHQCYKNKRKRNKLYDI